MQVNRQSEVVPDRQPTTDPFKATGVGDSCCLSGSHGADRSRSRIIEQAEEFC